MAQKQVGFQLQMSFQKDLMLQLIKTTKCTLLPNTDDPPKGDDEAALVLMYLGVELLQVDDDEQTKTYMDPIGEEAGVPNTPVDGPPNIKLPKWRKCLQHTNILRRSFGNVN
nr:hypothetical protein [Tanacetum cinerariifolium]